MKDTQITKIAPSKDTQITKDTIEKYFLFFTWYLLFLYLHLKSKNQSYGKERNHTVCSTY